MLRVVVRRSTDVNYFTNDDARELEGLRHGGPGWWPRGDGDANDPRDVARVLQSSQRSAIVGYDVIVAAPRPLSILMAIDESRAPDVIAAHRASVGACVDYLEEHAVVVRDRRGGTDREVGGQWSRVVAFTHGLNRHGEPHLHDHVLVGARPDGARTVLDSRALFAHASAADSLYRASFRHELSERTTWSSWRSFDGIDHVVGLDEGYRALWGGHHAQRGEKLHWSRRATAAAWASDLERFEPVGVLHAPERTGTLDEHAFAASFEGRFDVSRRHVVAAWANASVFGVSARDLNAAVDDHYPGLSSGRGVHEATIGVRDARMTALVRERGERPITRAMTDEWRQRSRPSIRSRSDRSR